MAVSAGASAKPFFDDVRAILQQARHKAYAASNFIMVEAYWQIGRRIERLLRVPGSASPATNTLQHEAAHFIKAPYVLELPSEEELRDELQRRHILQMPTTEVIQ